MHSYPADGYTLLLGTNATFALNSILYHTLPYDATSFKFVATTGAMPSFLIVSSKSKHKTLADFIEAAKEKPGAVRYASSGVGSTGDMVGKVLANAAGVELLHVQMTDESNTALQRHKQRAFSLGLDLMGFSTHQTFLDPDAVIR